MKTITVQRFMPVFGDAGELTAVFMGQPRHWLPGGVEAGGLVATLRASGVTAKVTCQVGVPWRRRNAVWRSLSWDPVTLGRLLPSFDGELALVSTARGVSLALDGRYVPPGGKVGAGLDTAGLTRVAESTAANLLVDIAVRLLDHPDATAAMG